MVGSPRPKKDMDASEIMAEAMVSRNLGIIT